MFSLTRKEQIAVSILIGALVVGSAISYWDAHHPDAIQEFQVVQAVEPPAVDSVQVPETPPERHKIDLNRATASELEELPRIGPILAARMIAWRESHGSFRSIHDLRKVRGIGEKTFAGSHCVLPLLGKWR